MNPSGDELETAKDVVKHGGPTAGLLVVAAMFMRVFGLRLATQKKEKEPEVSTSSVVETLLERIDKKIDRIHEDVMDYAVKVGILQSKVEAMQSEIDKLRVTVHDIDKLVAGMVENGVRRSISGEHKAHKP